MKITTTEKLNTDVLIIGSGAAGLRAAIEAKKQGVNVLLVSESPIGVRNNTAISAAGFVASGIWKGEGDSPELHRKDTLTAGRFLNDRRLVATITQKIPQQYYDLAEFGVKYVRSDGELFMRRGPGHSFPRNINAQRFRGVNITRPLHLYAAEKGVSFLEGVLICRVVRAEGSVAGAIGIDKKGHLFVIEAKSTILATGGAGQLYLRTNNPVGLTGDGYALAYEVGTTLRDMEFVQFYPTASGKHGSKMPFYERFMPRGAIIRNSSGEDILEKHGIGGFYKATRDMLTRIIMKEIIAGRDVNGMLIFDLTTMPEEKAEELYSSGLVRRGSFPDKIPIAPTCHFFIGGVKINEKGETGIDGLYSAGEVSGGAHGANRLAGTALAETFVFGTITGEEAAARASKLEQIPIPSNQVKSEVERLENLASGNGKENLEQVMQSLKHIMWDKVGIIRDKRGLETAQGEIAAFKEPLKALSLTDYNQLCQAIKLTNMLTLAEMVCRSALLRTETRGAHYRTDYPDEDDEQWFKSIEIQKQYGEMALRTVPVC